MFGMCPEAAQPTGAEPAWGVQADFGWALGVVFRSYLKAANAAVAELPGGPRGYQVLAAAARDQPRSQLALAQQLGVDRTVMTYLLDDLEKAGLVERRPDPADRRARRLTATESGKELLCTLDRRLRLAEEHMLGALDESDRETLRGLLQRVATQVDALDPVASACDVVNDIAGESAMPAGRRPRTGH
jgi:DNA-binding MarR family transcriptional regulator